MSKIILNSGYTMPQLGLGTWTMSDVAAARLTYEAICLGCRLIDTARMYHNEKGVGDGVRRAIAEGIVTREEIFVTSKISPLEIRDPGQALAEAYEKLGLAYIDLMLVHEPGPGALALYQTLEQGVAEGRIRFLGISNFYTPESFDHMAEAVRILPAVVQNEHHPYQQNTVLRAHLRQYGTILEAWYPFGGRAHTREVLTDPAIVEIAAAHKASPAQIVLAWQMQSGCVTIPGTENSAHLQENLTAADITLAPTEMQQIAALDRKQSFENWY